MIRDRIKDEQYFKDYVSNKIRRKEKYIERILNLPNPEEGFENSSVTLDLFTRQILIGKYSLGIEVKELLNDYENSIELFKKTYNSNSFYVQLIWMLSMGIMLDVKEDAFDKLTEMVENDNPKDYLVDFLINYRNKNWEIKHKTFKFNKPYGYLKDVIEAGNKAQGLVKLTEYLDKIWYKGHSGAGWHDNHNSKHDTYFGYWSFESGALAKVLELDDSSLKGKPYYPYDMVHFKDKG